VTDVDNDGLLNLSEFRKAVRDYRIDVTDAEISIIFNLFDPEETGAIDLLEFINSLRG
jgi:Ca2+-binding EF-hand superfamily protein